MYYIFNKNHKLQKFSIIVCSYNYGEFIEKTIQSVLEQSYKNFELILVNDGSTDNTNEIVNLLSQKRLDKHTNKKTSRDKRSFF